LKFFLKIKKRAVKTALFEFLFEINGITFSYWFQEYLYLLTNWKNIHHHSSLFKRNSKAIQKMTSF